MLNKTLLLFNNLSLFSRRINYVISIILRLYMQLIYKCVFIALLSFLCNLNYEPIGFCWGKAGSLLTVNE